MTANVELLSAVQSQLDATAALLKELGGEQHTKAPANFTTSQRLHGSGGLFAIAGLERDIITAAVRPYGISSVLPLIPSTYEDPRFGSITGVSDDIGDEPTYACEDAPTGYIKGCNLTARFGLLRRDTNTIDMNDTMRKLHRGDFTDLILRGRLLGETNLAPGGLTESDVLNIMTGAEMVNVGVRTERELLRQIWQGVVTVANQFPGLDVQIATGQQDADTGALCTSLDSDVKNYGYATVGASIVEYMSTLEWYLRNNATGMGLQPVEWVWVMRPDLWQELTAIWPCAYNTNRCANAVVGAASQVVIDGRENVTERDAMRNGMYIDVNGYRYRVITDTGIFEHNNQNNANLDPGEYASTIYFVPLTILGGMPVTYREYLDYRQAQPDVSLLRGTENFWWTDSGVYSWFSEFNKWCYKLGLKTEQRVVLRTPQLAGRIDAVAYSPMQHLRDPNPESPYWVDGGVSVRNPITTPYAAWTSR